ncbi:hypothetical protein BDV95DRAFT_177417 [Massariosphaeria phaeospora]|uniref:Uncharacterized protein n=1 Tax=Massariosphaeria phaeospora TaxID=100035 RepID=A0A7C8M9D8_9PLEO|nr:hypothetical protein BDV95DRAFT_177417 [Massariosphaeria phaeospora]
MSAPGDSGDQEICALRVQGHKDVRRMRNCSTKGGPHGFRASAPQCMVRWIRRAFHPQLPRLKPNHVDDRLSTWRPARSPTPYRSSLLSHSPRPSLTPLSTTVPSSTLSFTNTSFSFMGYKLWCVMPYPSSPAESPVSPSQYVTRCWPTPHPSLPSPLSRPMLQLWPLRLTPQASRTGLRKLHDFTRHARLSIYHLILLSIYHLALLLIYHLSSSASPSITLNTLLSGSSPPCPPVLQLSHRAGLKSWLRKL